MYIHIHTYTYIYTRNVLYMSQGLVGTEDHEAAGVGALTEGNHQLTEVGEIVH